MWKILVMMAIPGLLAPACSFYRSTDDPQGCQSQADCNPGKTCGDMIQCVDGECDPDMVVELPCDQGCDTDADCPGGMHCRHVGAEGECVADGTCADVSECLDLPHDNDCVGAWVCRDGWCEYDCGDIGSCDSDADCAVVTEQCCGCYDSRNETYIGVRADKVVEWYDRDECLGVQCEPCGRYPQDLGTICWDDECARAFCRFDGQGGRCAVEVADPLVCSRDHECQNATLACPSCGCESGYRESAINRTFLDAFLDYMDYACAMMGACALGPFGTNACTGRPGVCYQGRCEVLGQTCDCPDVWDPACVMAPNDALDTFPNPCQSACAWGEEPPYVVYPGRCECQADCDCDGPYYCAACAQNGVTYYCSYWEIECNGLSPLYPGECDPACDYCAFLGRMPIQACGADFFTYAEICYNECLGRDYRHLGACEPGEG